MRAEWKSLTREEERELVLLGQSGQDGDDEARKRLVADARNRVVMGFYPLIVENAKKIKSKISLHHRTTMPDLVQVGVLKVLMEFNKFKLDCNTRASTYFVRVANQGMWDYAMYKDMIIVLPARNFDVMSDSCLEAAKRVTTVGSLNYTCEYDDDMGSLLVDDGVVEKDIERADILARIDKIVSCESEMAQAVYRQRSIGCRYEEIARKHGVTKQNVQQIYKRVCGLILAAFSPSV